MLDKPYLDAIKGFEGFAPRAHWDFAQYTNGFGTRARSSSEVVDAAEADRRFRAELSEAMNLVDGFAPGLNEGARAALTSLTFNAGAAWMRGSLGRAIERGDLAAAQGIFLQYDKAGGQTLPGLQARRAQEAAWLVPETTKGGEYLCAADLCANPADVGLPAADSSNQTSLISTTSVCSLPETRAADTMPTAQVEQATDRSVLFPAMFLQMFDLFSQALTLDRKPDEHDNGTSRA